MLMVNISPLQTVKIQISWLLMKPADLNIHSLLLMDWDFVEIICLESSCGSKFGNGRLPINFICEDKC